MPRFVRLAGPSLAAVAFGSVLLAPPAAHAQAEPFIGQMMLTAATFCPRAWADANGQLLPISQNQALFSLLGTTYGGDGRTTFALPDLRGRAPIHVGQGPGLANITAGEKGGAEQTTLTVNTLPPHTHGAATVVNVTAHLNASSTAAATGTPSTGVVLGDAGRTDVYVAPPANVQLNPAAVTTTATATTTVDNTGGGQPVAIRSPYLGMRWCVALQGIFPSRN
jgi:microcystin-dependent protein